MTGRTRAFRIVLSVLVVLLLGLSLAGCGQKQAAQPAKESTGPKPVKFVFAGGGTGGVATLVATAIAEKIKTTYPGSVVDVVPGGTLTNILRIAKGDVAIGHAGQTATMMAYKGIPPPEEFKEPRKNLRGISSVMPSYYTFIVKRDFPAEYIEEVFEKKIPVKINPGGPRGHVGVQATEIMLAKAFGIKLPDIEKWGGKVVYSDFTEATQMMQDGHLDVFSPMFQPKTAAIVELATLYPIKILKIKPETVKKLEEAGYAAVTLPKDTYKGVNYDVQTFGDPLIYITRAEMPEDEVYRITKIICENKDHLIRAHESMAFWNPKEDWKNLPVPLHPGAERYYKEVGWLK